MKGTSTGNPVFDGRNQAFLSNEEFVDFYFARGLIVDYHHAG